MRPRVAALAWMGIVCALLAPAEGTPREAAPWRWWTDPTIVAEIALESRQSLAIERAQTESRGTRAAAESLLRDRRAQLGELLGRPTIDRREVARLLGEISRLQRQQLRGLVHLRLRVRRILRPEQLAHLLALHPMLMRQPWEPPAGVGRAPFASRDPTFVRPSMPVR